VTLFDRAVVRLLPAVPRSVVRRLSAPYIAGATLDDARRCALRLHAEGKLVTVDVLGEEVHSAEAARGIADEYRRALAALDQDGPGANVSVKPTAFGLQLDRDVCLALVAEVVADAESRNGFVRIDMEDSSCTDDTLWLYRELRARGHERIGVVLQAYLKRTLADIADLAPLRPSVRICKGIYVEPPEIAFQEDDVVRRAFVSALDALLDADCHAAIATHDEWLIGQALARVAGLSRDEYELQMLLGVREDRAAELVAAGHRLRVYVPYGEQWYEYSLRRLQENPKVAGYVARDVLHRAIPGR
jgi:proline dehydrogenase